MSGGISRRDVLDGDRQRGDLVLPRRRQLGAAHREQHLALEHEPVADDLDPRPVGQHLAQLAEELAAIALQLLHLGRQRHVQLLAEIGDLRVLLLPLRLRRDRAPWRPTASCAFSSSTCWLSSAICARAESPSFFSSASCASTAARRCCSVIARAAASCACFSSVVAQRGERAVLLGQLGEIGQPRRDGVLVRLHRLVELGDLLCISASCAWHRPAGRGSPSCARLGQLRRNCRGLLLRGIGAAGRRGEILLQLRPPARRPTVPAASASASCCASRSRSARSVSRSARGALRLRLQRGKLLRQRCRVPRWPSPVRG